MKQFNISMVGGAAAFIAMTAACQTVHADRSGSGPEKAARATSVTGLSVETRDGAELGTITGLVISLEDGTIESMVVETGFLGLGGPERVLGFDEFDGMKVDGSDFSLSVRSDYDAVENLPEFDEDALKRGGDGGSKVRKRDVEAMAFVYSDVETRDGSHLGEVLDWIIDLDDGVATHVIVRQLDPFSLYGGAYYAIGLHRLEGVRSGDIVTSVTQEDFSEAAELGEDESGLSLRDRDAPVFKFSYQGDDLAMSSN